MDAKKSGWLFLSTLIFEIVSTIALAAFVDKIKIGIIENLIYSQLIILLPTIIFLVCTREKVGSFIDWNPPKLSTSLLVIVLTYLCMPLMLTVNAISMLFVDNEVAALAGSFIEVPKWIVLLIVGIVGPVSEEFVFRGVMYHGLKRSDRFLAAAFISALLFGLTHMNFNQMSYAIVFGIIGVFVMEGFGSIFYSMLFHICINLSNAVQMVMLDNTSVRDMQSSKELIEQTMQMSYKQALSITISVLSVIAVITTALAGCLYWAIVKKENREEHIWKLLHPKTEGPKKAVWSVPLIIGMLLCLGVMIWDVCMAR